MLARRARPNGAAIIALREAHGLTQNQLAKAAGVAQASLSRIEANESRPRPDTMLKLANTLSVPLHAITLPSTEDAA